MALVDKNNVAFSYLLFPKKTYAEESKGFFGDDVDRLFYYMNRGVPVGDMPEPIYCTQEMVNQYGLDNLVANMQRKYKYDYDIIVVKVPQEDMRMAPMFGNSSIREATSGPFKSKMLPMLCRYDINGKKTDIISCNYIESVYLRYPDCRRIFNDNWNPVSPETMGMHLSEGQKKMLRIYGDDQLILANERRLEVMNENNLNTAQMCREAQNDKELQEYIGYSQETVDYLKKKYATRGKIFTSPMTKNRIKLHLMAEQNSKNRNERYEFIKG